MDDLGSAYSHTFANVGNTGIDYTEMNKGVTPIFFVEPVPDEKKTEEAGCVRMRELECVRIVVAGDMLNVATSPVTEEIKQRFATQYDAWKAKRQEMHIEGTPLRSWPLIPAIRLAEFTSLNIHSVENLAAVSDSNIHKLADGRIWREKAKAWLESAKDHGAAAKYAAENERLRESIDELKKQVAELAAAQHEEKRGPGRPRKDAA
jgi:hypothetical protein